MGPVGSKNTSFNKPRGKEANKIIGGRYPKERKEAVLAKLAPPNAKSVEDVAAEEGISVATIYNWRRAAREQGTFMPNADATQVTGWSAADKFHAVIETASMNTHEIGEFCRARGIMPEHLAAWRTACQEANGWAPARDAEVKAARKETAAQLERLQRELARNEPLWGSGSGGPLPQAVGKLCSGGSAHPPL